jgi:hypothetical protein
VGRDDLYRAVNERIQELTAPGAGFDASGIQNEYVCECGDPSCRTNISLLWQEFAEIAAEPGHYLVAAGHLGRDIEVIRRGSDYTVVRWLFDTPQSASAETGSSYRSESSY